MSRKLKLYCMLCAFLIFIAAVNVSAADLRSDLSYNFSNQTETEFYNSGTTSSAYNISGELPGYIYDIYDITPQPVYNSDFGTNIILPGGDFDVYPAGNKPYNAPESGYSSNSAYPQYSSGGSSSSVSSSQTTGTSSGTLPEAGGSGNTKYPSYPSTSSSANEYPSFSYEDEKTNSYAITSIDKVRNSDGSIGTLHIPKIGLTVTAYDGDTFDAMLKGVGHIASTSAWQSNIGLVGHNRGVSNNFGKLKNLTAGDEIQYTTKLGTRKYKVVSVENIADTDWSKLQYTNDNRITLITCLEDVPTQRVCVQAVELNNPPLTFTPDKRVVH